jgi:hypothetical protein
MRILAAKKSKYYDVALSHFDNARRCYERSGLLREWAALVGDVRRAHHRKAGFMADFERLAAGHAPSEAPSFLERAQRRWGREQSHDGQAPGKPLNGANAGESTFGRSRP